MKRNRSKLGLSNGDIDGSHTTALKGGEAVGYQGRKRRRTTNSLYLTDRQGVPLAMSVPVSGNHHDLFEIESHFEELTQTLEQAGIPLKGLFLNLDSGFDAENLRTKSESKDIIVNIAHNKRNSGHDNVHFLSFSQ